MTNWKTAASLLVGTAGRWPGLLEMVLGTLIRGMMNCLCSLQGEKKDGRKLLFLRASTRAVCNASAIKLVWHNAGAGGH